MRLLNIKKLEKGDFRDKTIFRRNKEQTKDLYLTPYQYYEG